MAIIITQNTGQEFVTIFMLVTLQKLISIRLTLFKSKKEIHLQSYIYYEIVDTYQKPVEITLNDTSTTQEIKIQESSTDIIKNEDTEVTVSIKKEKTEVNEVSPKKESKTASDKEIPKKTERIQRLTLFDDDDL